MRRQAARGRDSLSHGVQALADAGQLRALDIGPLQWQDVDTLGALQYGRGLMDRKPIPVEV